MAEKDILEKVLMSYADVFADCENVLTYGGRRRLKAEDICPAPELVDDIKLEVHHMKNLPEDIRKGFTSDMGFVADYLNEGSFEKRRNQKIVHMDALCEMMEALTQDTRFTDLAEEMLEKQREGKEIAMCEYIDMLEARGEARGIKIGEAQGIKIGEAQGIKIGEAQGIKIGETKGEDRLAQLITILIKEKKYHEVETVSVSRRKRHELYKQYGI